MTDLQTLLSNANHFDSPDAPDDVVDADVARGRRALTHRRLRRGGARVAFVAVAAVATIVFVNQPGMPSPPASQTAARQIPKAGTPSAKTAVHPAIELVSYTGAQPEGYTVDKVPAGWEIQGVNNFALVIGAAGDPDQNVQSFFGKLVVTLTSKDQTPPTTGTKVAVGDGFGLVRHDDPTTAQLSYRDAAGHWVDVQVPATLHWTDAQIGAFGAAVHVNANAKAAVG